MYQFKALQKTIIWTTSYPAGSTLETTRDNRCHTMFLKTLQYS